MTPKDKAITLVDLVLTCFTGPFGEDFDWRKCALIVVDEIIYTTLIEHSKEGHLIDEGYAVDYWNEVKKEINAL